MARRTHYLAVFVLAICLALTGSIGAQKKGPAPSSHPGTADFRCDITTGCIDPDIDPDRVIGDGTDYLGTGVAETGEGAHLNSNNEMWIGIGSGLGSGHHAVRLDFYSVTAPCQLTGNCRITDSFFPLDIDLENGEFQSNVLGFADNDPPAANGLLDIPFLPPTTWRSRLKITFADPLGNLLWGLNFNQIDYAGAQNINVTRTDRCTWEFQPGPGDVGGLSAFGKTGKGKSTRTDEGLYIMPFKITFHVPALCLL
jgi:hypothetical protein